MASYSLKPISYYGREVTIIQQNENGPCPLIALSNALLLSGRLSLGDVTALNIDTDWLVARLAEFLLTEASASSGLSNGAAAEAALSAAIACLPSMVTGLDVNVKFDSPTSFEFTPELSAFDIATLNLYHGWVYDPQESVAPLLARLSYNVVVERLITLLQTPLSLRLSKRTTTASASRSNTADSASSSSRELSVIPPSPASPHRAAPITLSVTTAGADGGPAAAGASAQLGDRGPDSQTGTSAAAAISALMAPDALNEPSGGGGGAAPSVCASLGETGPSIALSSGAAAVPTAATEGQEGGSATASIPSAVAVDATNTAGTGAASSAHAPLSDANTTTTLVPALTGLSLISAPTSHDEGSGRQTGATAAATASIAGATATITAVDINTTATAATAAASITSTGIASPNGAGAGAGIGSPPFAPAGGKAPERFSRAEAADVDEWLQRTASQLTYAGMMGLHEHLRPGEVAVFFRGNHFSCIHKRGGDIYLLVTDVGYANVPGVVWERLDDVDDTTLCGADFLPTPDLAEQQLQQQPSAGAATEGGAPGGGGVDADYMLAAALQAEEEHAAALERGQQQQQQPERGRGRRAPQQPTGAAAAMHTTASSQPQPASTASYSHTPVVLVPPGPEDSFYASAAAGAAAAVAPRPVRPVATRDARPHVTVGPAGGSSIGSAGGSSEGAPHGASSSSSLTSPGGRSVTGRNDRYGSQAASLRELALARERREREVASDAQLAAAMQANEDAGGGARTPQQRQQQLQQHAAGAPRGGHHEAKEKDGKGCVVC